MAFIGPLQTTNQSLSERIRVKAIGIAIIKDRRSQIDSTFFTLLPSPFNLSS